MKDIIVGCVLFLISLSLYGQGDFGYRNLLYSSGSHIAGKVAGTYSIGEGDPLAVSGTGTLYPIAVVYLNSADYNTNGFNQMLRLRAALFTNDVAPTGNFTIGLYPITRPVTSGGSGVCIYTLGTVVSGSQIPVFTTPVADAALINQSSDFAIPSTGLYVIGVVTTATVAVSSLVQINAQLQIHIQ